MFLQFEQFDGDMVDIKKVDQLPPPHRHRLGILAPAAQVFPPIGANKFRYSVLSSRKKLGNQFTVEKNPNASRFVSQSRTKIRDWLWPLACCQSERSKANMVPNHTGTRRSLNVRDVEFNSRAASLVVLSPSCQYHLDFCRCSGAPYKPGSCR